MRAFIALVLLCAPTWVHGAVIITEFAANNSGIIRDADDEAADWIELFNPQSSPIHLAGWHLTDDPENLTKWTFPAIDLGPQALLIVFASGKDRAQVGQELHTNFQLDNDGEYLALVRPDGTTIASEFGSAAVPYPPQREDVSYGRAQHVQTRQLITQGSEGILLVPTASNGGSALGSAWQGGVEPFEASTENGWFAVTNGVGFDLEPNSGKTVHVDINSGSVYSGLGANGMGGFWNGGGVNATNLKYSDQTMSTIAYRAEN